jgi:hypothetical protein
MTKTIVHYCSKCGRKLYTENESKYYNSVHGCTLSCTKCGITLIGVDLSVCLKCDKPMKPSCLTRYCSIIKDKEYPKI